LLPLMQHTTPGSFAIHWHVLQSCKKMSKKGVGSFCPLRGERMG
jgi:hypothetical protein